MQRRRGVLASGTVALLATLGLSACGGSSGSDTSPKGELTAGISQLSDSDTLTTTVKLDTTPKDLQAFARASHVTLDAHAAGALASAQFVIENAKGSGSHRSYDVRAVDGGSTLVELRVVDNTIYLQGDVQGILTLANKKHAYAHLQGQTSSMPDFVQAAVAGKWVSLQADALSSLAGGLGGSGASSSSGSGPKLLGELNRVIHKDVTVTKAGSDSRGDHLVLTADSDALAKDARQSVESSVPGGSALSSRLPTQSGAPRTVHFDAWVKDGVLTVLSIDLAQFGKKGEVPAGASLPLTVTFEQSGAAITAPSGAVPVDLTQLGTLVGALTGV